MSNLGAAEFLILGALGLIAVGVVIAVVVFLVIRATRH